MPPDNHWLSWLDTLAAVAGEETPTETMLDECLTVCLGREDWTAEPDVTHLYAFLAKCWAYPALKITIEAATQYWSKERKALLAQCVTPFLAVAQNGHEALAHAQVKRMSGNSLRAKEFPPLKWFAAGFLHEGNCIFAGKSKRGKSWLAFNIAISLATGEDVSQVFASLYATPRPLIERALANMTSE